MYDHDPSSQFRRRDKLPYDWQIRKQRRRRIAGRVLIGIVGLIAIAAVIYLSSHR
jgi:hypothetical protein